MRTLMLARFIAPKYFVVADNKVERRGTSGAAAFNWHTFNAGSSLAVFTSLEKGRDFIETYFAGEDMALPTLVKINAFNLARVVDHIEFAGVRSVVFDPVATSAGRWTDPQETMTSSYHFHFAGELYLVLSKLFTEAVAEVGDWRNSREDLHKVQEWCAPRVDAAIKDAHARVQEWIARDGPPLEV